MFDPITRRFARWRLRAETRRKLAMLDNRLLADIGTERSAIGDFVTRKLDEEECGQCL
ncbi:MAG: DUF1127 domain-containing protein [Devosia sp.]|uniref:DUF1127 domain-containing protein n=1 Tax=Devosia sp. TaxID=1871048 RepID=UPI0024C8754B|nr:DUF1127 domain-containing protein [Devosia sp.]UYN99193.1 MAG: DUF1127 domain-containing protein [Devosia sp.]